MKDSDERIDMKLIYKIALLEGLLEKEYVYEAGAVTPHGDLTDAFLSRNSRYFDEFNILPIDDIQPTMERRGFELIFDSDFDEWLWVGLEKVPMKQPSEALALSVTGKYMH